MLMRRLREQEKSDRQPFEEDEKEDDGEVDESGKREREKESRRTRRTATATTRKSREFARKAANAAKDGKGYAVYATSRDTDARVVSRLLRLTSAETVLLMYPSSSSSSSFSSSSSSSLREIKTGVDVSVDWIRNAEAMLARDAKLVAVFVAEGSVRGEREKERKDGNDARPFLPSSNSIVLVKRETDLSSTTRGEGGFGSTGK